MEFSENCTICPRLSSFLAEVKTQYPTYHCKPVSPFGDDDPKLLIVGLAPGKHGANATGRPFTGDHAGILLYEVMYKTGFSNQSQSTDADDGLQLIDSRITNAVKCLPPENKPTTEEVNVCNGYLARELKALQPNTVVLALGTIAHRAILKAYGLTLSHYQFGHAAEHQLPNDLTLLDSYHCSRYNTQTKRLTEDMFSDVFERARKIITRNG